MKQIIFATRNKAKLAQIRFVVEHLKLPIEIVGIKEVLADYTPYEEIGETVDEVALSGALAVSKLLNAPVITEDTDFRVEALNGEPGIRAGDFLVEHGRGEILKRMEGKTDRKAVVSSAVAYATPDGASKVFINRVEGIVASEEKWGDFPMWVAPNPEHVFGGGYNAIFVPQGFDKTLAEISPADAIPWSYRERNFVDVVNYILGLN